MCAKLSAQAFAERKTNVNRPQGLVPKLATYDRSNSLRELRDRYFADCGLIGSGLLLVALLVPQIGFRNLEGVPYSPLNHFVSELGWHGISHLAMVFNLGLIMGGVFLALFMIGLGGQFTGILAKLTTVFGVISAIGGSLVGVFSVDSGLISHLVAATIFFVSAELALISATFMILFQDARVVPKFIAIFSVLIFCIFTTVFTIDYPHEVFPYLDRANVRIINRPAQWSLPIVEWAFVLSIVIFLSLASLYFKIRSTNRPQQTSV